VTAAPDRAALETEWDFLVSSLADLEAERDAGDLSPAQFERLASTYTARAAAVHRTLDAYRTPSSTDAPDGQPGRSQWRRAGVAAALAAVVAIAAVVLPRAVGDRGQGQTITGNAQSAPEPTADALARAVDEDPNDPQARVAYARLLLDQGELVEAMRQYDAAVRLDEANAEALAYSGWILALAGVSDPRAGTTDAGLERIDRAIAADPAYPDAHMFRGMTLLNTGDPAGAVPELERYLQLADDGPMRAEVEAMLDEARRQAQAQPP
jgi:cytochrome c-type biogenesis protein CcmH/NrfG